MWVLGAILVILMVIEVSSIDYKKCLPPYVFYEQAQLCKKYNFPFRVEIVDGVIVSMELLPFGYNVKPTKWEKSHQDYLQSYLNNLKNFSYTFNEGFITEVKSKDVIFQS